MDYSEDAERFYLNEENKKKRKEIEEKYDAIFNKPDDSGLTPELENEFLKNVEEFERQHEKAKYVKVIDLIGNPKFKKIDELSGKSLTDAIEEVLNIYGEHEINISIIEEDEVSDRDFYIFLTEELPEEETEDIRMPGWTTNYIYEEFHPSDKLNAKDAIEDILLSAINQNREFEPVYVAKNNLLDPEGKPTTKNDFIESVYALFEDVEEIIEREFLFKNFEFGEKNLVNIDFILRYRKKNSLEEIDKILNFTFELLHSEYGGMEIISYKLNS